MEPFEDDKLVATLESLRPEPSEEFAAMLDERAAAGFPRREGGGESRRSRLRARLRALEPRRLVLPAGGVAVIAIAFATAATVATTGGGGSSSEQITRSSSAARGQSFEPSARGGADEKHNATPSAGAEEAATEGGAAASSGGGMAPSAAELESRLIPFSKSHTAYSNGSGPYAADAKHRAVERAAEITLGTAPDEVGKAAGKVLETVHSYDGIVLDSSVRGGSEGEAGARFTLLIPSAKLNDALAAFSGIAEVRTRQDSSNDITAPTVTTGEELRDSHARVESLLNQLAAAETEAEQQAVEAKLRAERRHQARLRSALSALHRRANLSRVSLRIVSDEAPASGGAWDAGSALHDAGRLLSVAAGVAIVALAALAPIVLLALLAWLAHRAWLRGRRERALG